MYKQITKHQAFRLWCEGKTIYLNPCKMGINMWNTECPVKHNEYYLNDLELNKKAWDIMYNEWAFYNTNYEMGYYAHYYIKV